MKHKYLDVGYYSVMKGSPMSRLAQRELKTLYSGLNLFSYLLASVWPCGKFPLPCIFLGQTSLQTSNIAPPPLTPGFYSTSFLCLDFSLLSSVAHQTPPLVKFLWYLLFSSLPLLALMHVCVAILISFCHCYDMKYCELLNGRY